MKFLNIVFVSFILSGCSSVPSETENISANKVCKVNVYRNETSFHKYNPELPFLFVDGQQVGKLEMGKSHCLDLAAGKHELTVKHPILFMPSWTTATMLIDVTETGSIFVRYANEYKGAVTNGSTVVATGQSNLRLASEEEWRKRL